MSISLHQSKIIWAIVMLLLFSSIGTTATEAKAQHSYQSFIQGVQKDIPNLLSGEKALYAIEDIPVSVVKKGHNAILIWLKHNIDDPSIITALNSSSSKTSNGKIHTLGLWGCVSAVGAALVGLAWAPAKILKIKNALKALGGVKTFVTKAIAYYKVYKKRYRSKTTAWKKAISKAAAKASPEIRDALLGFFGITAIIDTCTS